jgi:hypothetical protein
MNVTLFSWGYWGWGNATERLVEAFDKTEKSREFRSPLFVDARLRRQGRAKGFVGNAFRDLVGPSRYRWMKDLGNLAIATGSGGVQIKNPAAVAELVDLALHAADERRRVIFYCACEYPSLDGALVCHRLTIVDLLLAHAKKIGRSISVVEWPGGRPIEPKIEVSSKILAAVVRGRKGIPLLGTVNLAEVAGLPWGSIAKLESDSETTNALVGPARYSKSTDDGSGWYLPVLEPVNREANLDSLRQLARQWRKDRGLEVRE